MYSQQVFLDKFSFLCSNTVDKFSLTSFLSCVYSQQVFLDKFSFLCSNTVDKFSLTSFLSCVYSQQVFLDKFSFLCFNIQLTSFPWQVFFLVCTVNKFPLTSFVALVRNVVKTLFRLRIIRRILLSLPKFVQTDCSFLVEIGLFCQRLCIYVKVFISTISAGGAKPRWSFWLHAKVFIKRSRSYLVWKIWNEGSANRRQKVSFFMFVMLLWVYIHTGQAWKIYLATVGIEPTTFSHRYIYGFSREKFE